jgi:3-dehydroquinate synthase
MAPSTLTVALAGRSYPIHIGTGRLAQASEVLPLAGRKCLLLTDENVAAHYLVQAQQAFGLLPEQVLVLPAGEPSKSWESAGRVLDWMLGHRLARDALLIAFGGGVIGDLAGFCAAIYQRGIAFVQVPTTLLAMVDSSVGGKTGINHPRGKNMIGAFHQPEAVLADLSLLDTLSLRERAAGLAEIIKYGLLGDAAFYQRLLNGGVAALVAGDHAVTAETVAHCCAMKAAIVAQDEREAISGGPRALLNLGHTFGHAVEAYTGYATWLHGEAVGLGLLMAADLSARLGALTAQEVESLSALLLQAGLPALPPAGMTPAHFRSLMAGDKKVAAGRLRLVLLRRIGEAVLSADFDDDALGRTLAQFCH